MDPNRSRYKQVGAKFRSADDSRAARAIATKDGQRIRRSTALHVRRSIPGDLTPVDSPESQATTAPQARLPATAALANVRAKIAQLVSKKTVACSMDTNVQQVVTRVAEENTISFTKKQGTKSMEQQTKERMEALKIYKQRKQRQLDREKKTRKPTFWIGVAKREPKVLLLPTVAESNSSKLETPGCTPSKQNLPVWHTGFSSISKKSAALPSTVSRNSRSSSRNLFSSALKGSLDQTSEPRLQRQQSQGFVAPPTDVTVHRGDGVEDFRPADPDSFAPSGYTFTAPDGLQQPRLVSAAASPRRPSTIRFSKVPVLPATPSERVPKRMPSSKTPKPGAPRIRSRSSSTVSSDRTTATSPCSSKGLQLIRSSSVRSRKESSDCEAINQSSTRESYLDESQHSNVSSCVRTTRASKTSTSSFTSSGGDGIEAATNSSVLSASNRRSARTYNRDSLGIEILEASPPTVARFKRRNPVHQLLPILGDLPTETVAATVHAETDSHSHVAERGEYCDATEVQLSGDVEPLLQKRHPSIEDDKESLSEECSFTGVFHEPSNEHVISPKDQSPGLHALTNRALKRKRSSPVSLPSAKKCKEITRINRSETSVRDDALLQPESSKVNDSLSSRSAAVDFSSSAHVESPQQNAQSSTPGLAIVESETEIKFSTDIISEIVDRHSVSPLGRTPKSSGRLSLASDGTLSAHAVNSSLTEGNKSAGRDVAQKSSSSRSLNRSHLSPPFKGNDLGCSPQLQQTQARWSLPKFVDDHAAPPVASGASNLSKSVASPIRTPVSVSVSSTYCIDDPPQTSVVATLKSDRTATSSLRKSSRLTLSTLEESSVATPSHASQRLAATTPCSRSTRRSLAVRADATWQEHCTTPSVTTKTPGKRGRRKTVQEKLDTEEEPRLQSREVLETDASIHNVNGDKSEVTKDAVLSHVDAPHAATEDIKVQMSTMATFKTPQSSGRGRLRRGSIPAVHIDSASRTLSSSREKHCRKIVIAAPSLSFLSTDTSTDGASPLPSASEQGSSDEPSPVSWMVRESPFINHESRSAKRRKAQERASRHGTSPFDLVFTAEDLAAAADRAGRGCSPALSSANGGPSDGLAELLRPSTPCLDQPASPDVWAEMSTPCHTADPISDPLSITNNAEMEEKDTIGHACDAEIRVNKVAVPGEVFPDEMILPDIVLSNNDQSQSDDKDDAQEEGDDDGERPSSIDVAELPATSKKDTPRRGKGGRRSRQSLAVAAALESSRRVLLAAAAGQENRPPRVSFAPDAHNNRVSLGLFAPGAFATPAPSGSVVPDQDLICLDSPQSGLTVPTGTMGDDLIALDTPTPKGRKGQRGRSSRVSQLAALYESPSPSTPRGPSAKTGTPATLRRSSRRSVLTPRPENFA